MSDVPSSEPSGALARLSAALGEAGGGGLPGRPGLPGRRGLPPVERWNPPHCGAIDMRIAADGTWSYMGSPIGRPALVKLFASVLRREEDGSYVLVTPVERVGITVEDAPFLAVEMAVEGEGDGRSVAFRTNVDDLVPVDADHGLTFARDADGGLKPYLHVRRGLTALVTRALVFDLVELCEIRRDGGEDWFGLPAGGGFHRVARTAELDGLDLG
jgi:uncharacterized protein